MIKHKFYMVLYYLDFVKFVLGVIVDELPQ